MGELIPVTPVFELTRLSYIGSLLAAIRLIGGLARLINKKKLHFHSFSQIQVTTSSHLFSSFFLCVQSSIIKNKLSTSHLGKNLLERVDFNYTLQFLHVRSKDVQVKLVLKAN